MLDVLRCFRLQALQILWLQSIFCLGSCLIDLTKFSCSKSHAIPARYDSRRTFCLAGICEIHPDSSNTAGAVSLLFFDFDFLRSVGGAAGCFSLRARVENLLLVSLGILSDCRVEMSVMGDEMRQESERRGEGWPGKMGMALAWERRSVWHLRELHYAADQKNSSCSALLSRLLRVNGRHRFMPQSSREL